jgi:predicted transcriptional regulator
MPEERPPASLDRELTANIVGAYVRQKQIGSDQLATLISTVHQALAGLGKPAAETETERTPAVPIRRSVHHDYVVCLECGWRALTLRRHLTSRHGLSTDQYRARWKLPREHPITAPSYSERRSGLAKQLGLGRGRTTSSEEPEPVAPGIPAAEQPRSRRRVGRDQGLLRACSAYPRTSGAPRCPRMRGWSCLAGRLPSRSRGGAKPPLAAAVGGR